LAASLPSVKSKWVGETEQNLQSLFEQSRSRRAVLFIDEADALLMERGEGRASRHDDSVVDVLLTLIERHQNVVVLATNRPQSLDDALERRLTYTIEFPFPDAELRSRIWENHLPSEAPTGEDVDVVALGERFELSGGLIKQAVFKAAFRAASDEKPISMELLEEAAERQGIGGDETRDVGFFRED
jgi:SpoVK/Ycf46/Vps4 family AAA+-type ATPase